MLMTSPYLDQARPTRKMIEALIAARDAELSRLTDAAERRRVEHDLAFLRDEPACVARRMP
jgi:hypothetical protein